MFIHQDRQLDMSISKSELRSVYVLIAVKLYARTVLWVYSEAIISCND